MEVASGIAGLIGLADMVLTKAYKLYSALKGAISEIKDLLNDVLLLYGALNSLKLVISQLELYGVEQRQLIADQPNLLKEAIIKSEHLQSCRGNLERLCYILEGFKLHDHMSKPALLKVQASWLLKASEAQQIAQDIQKNKSNILLALQATELSALVSILKGQDALNKLMNDQTDILKRLDRINDDVHKREVLNWASIMNHRAAHKANKKLRHSGTAEWFSAREEYSAWKSSKNGRLWLYGIPGAGKSIMVSSIIDSIIKGLEDDDAVAFHYCDYKSKESQSLENILCSLIMQTALQSKLAFDELSQLYEENNSEHSDQVHLRDCDLDLVKVLQKLSIHFSSLTIVIDGLDECTNDREDVAQELDRLPDTVPGHIKILIASRLEQEFKDLLAGYSSIEIGASRDDIQLYVAAILETKIQSRKLKIKDHSLKTLIISKLVDGAQGMFQWVVCQIDHLCHLGTDKDRRHALDNLPPGLNGIYQNILQRVVSNDYSNHKQREYLIRILRWLAFSEIPISLTQLTEAVADVISSEGYYDSDSILDRDTIVHWGSSLIRINEETDCLEFSHFTVKDFLLDKDNKLRAPFDTFKLDEAESQAWISTFCLKYLMLKDFRDSYHLDEDDLTKLCSNYHFLQYADRFWDTHVRMSLQTENEELNSLIKEFLATENNPYFVRWRKCSALLGPDLARPNTILNSEFFQHDSIHFHFAAAAGLLHPFENLTQHKWVNSLNPVCGSPLSAALWKVYVADEKTDNNINYSKVTSENYNKIISNLIDAGADPNTYICENPFTNPLYAFFQASSYDPVVSKLLFTRVNSSITKTVVNKFCRRIRQKWITGAEAIELMGFSDSRHWNYDDKAKICEAVMKAGSSEGEAMYLLEDLELARFPNKDAHTKISGPFIEGHIGPLMLQRSSTFKEVWTPQFLRTLHSAISSGMLAVVESIALNAPWVLNVPSSNGDTALTLACRLHHEAIVRCLLSHKAEVNRPAVDGFYPLHCASGAGELGYVQLLLEAGADVNKQDMKGMTALMILWAHTKLPKHWQEISDAILSKNIDFGLQSKSKDTYCHLAACLPEVKYLQIVLDQSQDINIDAAEASKGFRPLHLAAFLRKHDASVRLLLHHGAKVDLRDNENATPLMIACRMGSPGSIACLIEAGADLLARDNAGWLPQHYACDSRYATNLPALLAADRKSKCQISLAKQCKSKGKTALHIAVENRWPGAALELVKRLLKEEDINVNCVDLGKSTPLNSAAWKLGQSRSPETYAETSHTQDSPCYIRLQIVKILLPLTNPPCAFDMVGHNAFSGALLTDCHLCWEEVVLEFIGIEGITLESHVTTTGQTPLLLGLSRRASWRKVDWLLSRGVDASVKDFEGSTTLDCVVRQEYPEALKIARRLLSQNVDVNAKNAFGMTPLMEAIQSQQVQVAKILINNGADVSALAPFGHSALHYAVLYLPDPAAVTITTELITRGADINTKLTAKACKGVTPLMSAIRSAKFQTVSSLLDQPLIDIDATTQSNGGLWHMAVSSLQPDGAVTFLANKGLTGQINLRNTKAQTPLHLAIQESRSEDLIRTLLDSGSDIFAEDRSGNSYFSHIVKLGAVDKIRLALERIPRFRSSNKQKLAFHRFGLGVSPPSSEILRMILLHHDQLSEFDFLCFCRFRNLDDELYELVLSFVQEERIIYRRTDETSTKSAKALCQEAHRRTKRGKNNKFRKALKKYLKDIDSTEKAAGNPEIDVSDSGSGGSDSQESSPSELSETDSDQAVGFGIQRVGCVKSTDWFAKLSKSIVSFSWEDESDEIRELLLSDDFQNNKNESFALPFPVYQLMGSQGFRMMTILELAFVKPNIEAALVLLHQKCRLDCSPQFGPGGGYNYAARTLYAILKNDDAVTLTLFGNTIRTMGLEEEHQIHPRVNINGNLTPIHFLASTGGWRCLKPLLELYSQKLFSGNVDSESCFSLIDMRAQSGATPLRLAVENNNLNFIKEIFKLSEKPKFGVWEFPAALSLKARAIEVGNLDIADFLIKNCPDDNVNSSVGFNPNLEIFHVANTAKELDALLRSGADIEFWDEFQGHPVHYLLKGRELESFEVVLAYLGAEKSILQLTKRAMIWGHALEIIGDTGNKGTLTLLQNTFGFSLAGFSNELIKDGRIAALKQGYIETAKSFEAILQSRTERVEANGTDIDSGFPEATDTI